MQKRFTDLLELGHETQLESHKACKVNEEEEEKIPWPGHFTHSAERYLHLEDVEFLANP